MSDNSLSIEDAQKVATMLREDKKADSQILVDTHNRRAGKLQWLRMAIFGDTSSNVGAGKSLFEGEQLQALIDRYGRCLLAWTRSDELDGVVEDVRPEAPYTT